MTKKYDTDEIRNAVVGVKNGRNEDLELIRASYAPLVESMVLSFEKSGAGSRSDLLDEAYRALLKAVISFDDKKRGISFGLYAKICIRNALISYRRATLSRERKEKRTAEKVRSDSSNRKNPVFSGLDTDEIMDKMKKELSAYEFRVLKSYADGSSISRIAEETGRGERSVNNALYRIRRKAKNMTEN